MSIIKGRYTLECEIGRGAFGSVWTARDGQLGRRVAIKLLRADYVEHPSARARFEHEARTIAQLRSPHIVLVHDAGVSEEQPFIVMELLEGESLETRLHRHQQLPLALAGQIVVQVAKGLARMHQEKIIHRDIKPANIFLARENGQECAKILDFGVATLLARAAGDSSAASAVYIEGTPHYMSSEQLGGAEPDERADLWSLAVLAYEMLTGRCPFEASDMLSLRAKVSAGVYERPSSCVSGLSPAVDAFFEKALAKSEEDRFQTAANFAAEFLKLVESPGPLVTRVLFVDDEPDMEFLLRQKFRRELREGRYEIYFAADGNAGLDELRRRPDIDLVMTDINMPGMDGLAFLARVPEVNPLARVVMVSAYSDMENIRTAMNRGAFDFLVKPIDFDDLQRTIDKAASHVAFLRESLHSQEENDILRALIGQGVVDRLLTAIRATDGLPHERFDGTVAFIDVHGFSTLPLESPADVFRHLNGHFEVFMPEVMARRGSVCRFVGEGIFAVFDGHDHLFRAIEACIAIRDRLLDLHGHEPQSGTCECGTSVGIDTGTLLAGGVGSTSLGRLEHVVLGDAVRRAARLQILARNHDILISSSLQAQVANDFRCEADHTRSLCTANGTEPVFRIVGSRRSP